jgi:hypothetical protein
MLAAPWRSAALGVLAAALAACKGPVVPSPLAGQSRYLCCNMHYEKPEITDVNYQRGTLIPVGTRVQIVEVRRNTVKFLPDGHPPITLSLRYGKDVLSMDQYMERIFVEQDPRASLRPPPVKATRGGKGSKASAAAAEAAAAETEKHIEQGIVDEGMTREQVLMALGYPPAHRTPSLDAATWTYWGNRWETFQVYFDGDRVSRVGR